MDSKEDFELILLARELDATIVSADVGILTWAQKMGIRWIDASTFRDVLEGLVRKLEGKNL